MRAELTIAGALTLLLAAGHTTLGTMWVLPRLTEERVPKTPFGPASLTVSMIRVTWFVVTIFALAMGGLLLTLALDADVDARAALLRWFAAMWLAATVMVLWIARGSLGNVLRFPVPLIWLVVAVLCWMAST